MITDAAITVPVGKIDAATKKLISITEEAMYAGIKKVKAGNTTGDIGSAIFAIGKKAKFGIVDNSPVTASAVTCTKIRIFRISV